MASLLSKPAFLALYFISHSLLSLSLALSLSLILPLSYCQSVFDLYSHTHTHSGFAINGNLAEQVRENDTRIKKTGVSALTPSTFSVPVSLGELSLWQVALWENEFLIAWRKPFSHKTVSVTPVRQNYVGKMDSALPLLRLFLCICVNVSVCVFLHAWVCMYVCITKQGREKEDEKEE